MLATSPAFRRIATTTLASAGLRQAPHRTRPQASGGFHGLPFAGNWTAGHNLPLA